MGIVATRDQIDVVHPLVLQLQKNVPQTFHGDHAACLTAADGVVLAKYTAQVASGEENRAGASCSRDAGLLSEVRGCTCNHGHFGNLTEAKTGISVNIAVSWAHIAQIHIINSLHF
jgi:hypothetical protein